MGAFRLGALGAAALFSLIVFCTAAEAAERSFAIYVVENDSVAMKRALANAISIDRYFRAKGDTTAIEIVTTGAGVHMLRADTSPVAGLVLAVSRASPTIGFSVSEETLKKMARKEGQMPPTLEGAIVVPSGPGRLAELQGKGYGSVSYSLLMSIHFDPDQPAGGKVQSVASAAPQPINAPVSASAVPPIDEAR